MNIGTGDWLGTSTNQQPSPPWPEPFIVATTTVRLISFINVAHYVTPLKCKYDEYDS